MGTLEIWVDGKLCPGAELVYVEEDQSYEEDWAEPIALDGVEAALNFVKKHFPEGWQIDGDYPVPARSLTTAAPDQGFKCPYCGVDLSPADALRDHECE